MNDMAFFGQYLCFNTNSKKDGAALMSSDCIVGDIYTLESEFYEAQKRAWLINPFGKKIGFFNEQNSNLIALKQAQGYHCCALLTCVVFSEIPHPSNYWGEVALLCFKKNTSASKQLIQEISAQLAQGRKPDLAISKQKLDSLEQSKELIFTHFESYPSLETGEVFLKKRRRFVDNLVIQGRERRLGCMIISWVFLLFIVSLVVIFLNTCSH